jgi:hypothetical protein
MPGARCARSLACKEWRHTSVATTGTPGSPGIPAHNGFNGLLRAPRRSGFLVIVACRKVACPRPVGPTLPSADLMPASRRQDHTTSPSAKVPFVCVPFDRSQAKAALPSRATPDAPASTVSRPALKACLPIC